MPDFYELGLSAEPGWLLRVPDVQPLRRVVWRLLDGRRLAIDEETVVPVVVSKRGEPLGFSLTGTGIPIVRSDVARALEEIAPDDVQFVPASIEGSRDLFEILNVTTVRDCIDEQASSFSEYRGPGDFHAVNKLVIDPARAEGSHVFRVRHCTVALVVSDVVREALVRLNARGVGFFPAC